MLIIMFLNDGTGDEIEGNYKWKVMINQRTLAEGTIKGHNRLSGWEGLIKYFANALSGEDAEFTIKKHKRHTEEELDKLIELVKKG